MVRLEDVKVSIKDIRSPGAAGFSDNIEMVTYVLAKEKLDEAYKANELLNKENAKWAKEVELLRVENWRLKKDGGKQ